ncbi:MAG: hypothetical protein PHX18_02550 [Candidatus Gastranaerophilales bacterium]|nr:hypothetical protein [Candidatus Gastranaerophilales bacterium]
MPIIPLELENSIVAATLDPAEITTYPSGDFTSDNTEKSTVVPSTTSLVVMV